MSQTEKYVPSDVIISESPREFNREAKTISIANNAEIVVGQLLEAGANPPDTKALAVDANAAFVCLENYKNTTGATITKKIAVLARGGGLILNYNRLNGEASVKATAVAALKAAFGGDDNCVIRTPLS